MSDGDTGDRQKTFSIDERVNERGIADSKGSYVVRHLADVQAGEVISWNGEYAVVLQDPFLNPLETDKLVLRFAIDQFGYEHWLKIGTSILSHVNEDGSLTRPILRLGFLREYLDLMDRSRRTVEDPEEDTSRARKSTRGDWGR